MLSDVDAGIVSGQYPLEEGPLSQMSDAVASLDKEPHTPAQQVNTKYFYPKDQIFSRCPCPQGPATPGLPATPNTPGTQGHKSPRQARWVRSSRVIPHR